MLGPHAHFPSRRLVADRHYLTIPPRPLQTHSQRTCLERFFGRRPAQRVVTSMTQDRVSTIQEDVVDFNSSPNMSFKVLVDDQTPLTDTEPWTTNDTPSLQSDRTDSNPTMTKNKENKKDTNHSENPREPIQETPVVWEIDESEDLPDPRPIRAKFHTRYLTLATMIKNQRR